MSAYAAFRYRDYRLVAAGSILSTLGQQMLSVVVGWDLYLRTRSALVLGNVGLVQVIPVLLFALVAGHVADRYNRRHILLCTQALLLTASVTLTTAGSGRPVWLIFACLFLVGFARAFQMPANSALVPSMVPPQVLTNAIAWLTSGREIASMVGPAVAGVLLARFGSTPVYMAQGLCALATLLCYSLVRYTPAERQPVTTSPWKTITDGARFVWHDRLILPAISLDLFAVLFGGATALLPIYAVDILHTGVKGLGWLRAAPAVGACSMAVALAHTRLKKPGMMLLGAVAAFGLATIFFGVSRNPAFSFSMLLLTGMFDNVSVVLRQSLIQMRTPDALRGRVSAVSSLFINCSNQLGAVESGLTAQWFGTVPSVVGGGAATIAVVLAIALVFPTLRAWKAEPVAAG